MWLPLLCSLREAPQGSGCLLFTWAALGSCYGKAENGWQSRFAYFLRTCRGRCHILVTKQHHAAIPECTRTGGGAGAACLHTYTVVVRDPSTPLVLSELILARGKMLYIWLFVAWEVQPTLVYIAWKTRRCTIKLSTSRFNLPTSSHQTNHSLGVLIDLGNITWLISHGGAVLGQLSSCLGTNGIFARRRSFCYNLTCLPVVVNNSVFYRFVLFCCFYTLYE